MLVLTQPAGRGQPGCCWPCSHHREGASLTAPGSPRGSAGWFQGHKVNSGRSQQPYHCRTLRNFLNVKHLLSFSHKTPGQVVGPPGTSHQARRKAPRAISSNKENNAGEIEFSADLFNLVISEHLVLAVMGEWAASR